MKALLRMPKTIKEVAVAYDKAAPLYDLMNRVYFFGRDKRFRSMLVERLDLNPDDIVMDLCCGTGPDFPFLLRKIKIQGTLLGVDLSSKMLQRAKKKIKSRGVSLVRQMPPIYPSAIRPLKRFSSSSV